MPDYLDPQVIGRIKKLEMRSLRLVESFMAGSHKSRLLGISTEFAQHRQYVPGDDTKHLDWKVFGKTDRFYIKEYEEETNLSAWILLDISESMDYKSGAVSKLEYVSYIAAALPSARLVTVAGGHHNDLVARDPSLLDAIAAHALGR